MTFKKLNSKLGTLVDEELRTDSDLTSVVRHRCLLLVPLFLELNVSQLHDCGANLQDI